MNSTVFDDLNREHFALEAAKCLENIFANSQNVTTLHKELLEVNLSITAYITESENRLKELRLSLANSVKSSIKVAEIFSDKYNFLWEPVVGEAMMLNGDLLERHADLMDFEDWMLERKKGYMMQGMHSPKMTTLPQTPPKRKCHRAINTSTREANNNSKTQFNKQQSARNFAVWYKHMVDNDRQNLSLYLSDDVMLEWFGKTIKTRKKVSFFLTYDMQYTRHDFTTVESIEKIQTRYEQILRKDDSILASPLHSPEIGIPRRYKRKMDSGGHSPQWAEGCKPDADDDDNCIAKKRVKSHNIVAMHITQKYESNDNKDGESNEISHKGDGIIRRKRKFMSITPPNIECGQGDCLPSTSGTSNSEASHDTLNAQLPKLAVECNGYIVFTRTRNNCSTDGMKWDRNCKLQVSYSEDPLNVGEYIIWGLRYSDESKCRRNLMAAFDEASKDE